MRRRIAAALCCAAWLSAGGVAQGQGTLPPGYSSDMSGEEAGIWMLTDKQEAATKTAPNLVRDEKLNAYVSGVICRLAGEYCPSIRVYILDTPNWNAFASPNGMVVVNTGLLLQMKNEAQFAFVLGHEITHYLHRHSLEELRKQVNTAGLVNIYALAMFGVGVAVGDDPSGAISLGQDLGRFWISAFSRDEERDADRSGFARVTSLGYAPNEASAIWTDMVAQNKADPRYSRIVFLDTHPSPEERVENNVKWAAEALPSRSDWVTNEDAYHAAMAPFLRRWVEEELALAHPDRSIVIFRRLAQNMPSQGLYHFGLGEAYRKRHQKPDEASAEKAYRAALACPDAPPEAWRGLGLLAMRAGESAKAKDAFTNYQAKLPNASDKAMIDFYLSQL